MPLLQDFVYLKPKRMDELLRLLDKYQDGGFILAGGTDLIVRMREELDNPEALIDIKGLEELGGIKEQNGSIEIGANVTFSDILDSEIIRQKLPVLFEASAVVASMGIRNRATLIGNICSAVPSLDSGPALLNYEAEVIVENLSGERVIPIHLWFKGPHKTSKRPDELVKMVRIPIPDGKTGGSYVKLGRYRGEDLAQAGVAVLMYEDLTYRVSLCALGPVPKRAYKVEEFLNKKKPDVRIISKAVELIEKEINPITDIRATKEYRTHMAKVMLKMAIEAAYSRLRGEGPSYGTRFL